MDAQTLIPDTEARAQAVRALVEAAVIETDGKRYMQDARGALMPLDLVRQTDRLEDQTVRALCGFAFDLSQQLARFKGHSYADFGALMALLSEEYGVQKGGRKGNVTLTSYDGRFRVQFAVAERMTFGPELQVARALFDECLAEWSEDTRSELKALIADAFRVDKEGNVSREALFRLMRVASEDPRWNRAIEAIKDSIRVIGSKSYIRFYRRDDPLGGWDAIPLDLAAV